MDREWHTAEFPELRERPPWVMEEMVASQADLPDGFADDRPAAALLAAIEVALGRGEPVWIAGCGTSEHAAMGIARILGGGAVRACQSLDLALDPPDRGLVIGISHDGGTRATLLALQRAAQAGCSTAAITARPESEVGSAAEFVLATPALDRSWCHTVAYTGALLAGAAIAHAGQEPAWIETCRSVLQTGLAERNPRAAGARLLPAGRIVVAGLGVGLICARELALKLEEGARVPATAHHLETLLHGHLAGCDAETTRLVLFGLDPAGRAQRRLGLAAAAAAAIGIPCTAVVAGDPAGLPEGVQLVRLAVPESSPGALAAAADLLASAVALQQLTLGAIDAAGTNPDLIRRDQEPYRAAAALADGSGDW